MRTGRRLLPLTRPAGLVLLGLTMYGVCSWGVAWGQTGLTTIQDTLFRADGTRFSGTLTIHWSTFDANNIGTIVQQSRSVQVVNGNLELQLAPNASAQAPANTYIVNYQSDGREQFSESWTVSASGRALKVSEVRTGVLTSSSTAGNGSATSSTPIPESAVTGLQADLSLRPVKGAAYGTGGVAVVDDTGALQTAVGNTGDCVLVDGTAGPCGSAGAIFADAETPGGLVDGTNGTFTLAYTPLGASLQLYRNGLYMSGGGFDYTLTGSQVQFVAAAVPQPGDQLVASYRVDPASAGNVAGLTGGSSHSSSAQVLCSAAGSSTRVTAFQSVGACDVAASQLKPGDRIEVRVTFTHQGTAGGFDVQVNWGTVTALARHGSSQDAAFAGQVEASVIATGAQLTTQSWGTVLAFLPSILNAPSQAGLKIDIRGAVGNVADTLRLTNFTVLRYPAS